MCQTANKHVYVEFKVSYKKLPFVFLNISADIKMKFVWVVYKSIRRATLHFMSTGKHIEEQD